MKYLFNFKLPLYAIYGHWHAAVSAVAYPITEAEGSILTYCSLPLYLCSKTVVTALCLCKAPTFPTEACSYCSGGDTNIDRATFVRISYTRQAVHNNSEAVWYIFQWVRKWFLWFSYTRQEAVWYIFQWVRKRSPTKMLCGICDARILLCVYASIGVPY